MKPIRPFRWIASLFPQKQKPQTDLGRIDPAGGKPGHGPFKPAPPNQEKQLANFLHKIKHQETLIKLASEQNLILEEAQAKLSRHENRVYFGYAKSLAVLELIEKIQAKNYTWPGI
jgi:hypothetical protein